MKQIKHLLASVVVLGVAWSGAVSASGAFSNTLPDIQVVTDWLDYDYASTTDVFTIKTAPGLAQEDRVGGYFKESGQPNVEIDEFTLEVVLNIASDALGDPVFDPVGSTFSVSGDLGDTGTGSPEVLLSGNIGSFFQLDGASERTIYLLSDGTPTGSMASHWPEKVGFILSGMPQDSWAADFFHQGDALTSQLDITTAVPAPGGLALLLPGLLLLARRRKV